MPIKVILQNIDGSRRIGSVVDGDGGLNKCLPINDRTFQMLQFVDPYGNTVFNKKQMPQLLEELELLIRSSRDDQLKSLLEEVQKLAKECQNANHLYLRFVGD